MAIQKNSPGSTDQHAALIAEHLEAAGDLRAAFDWHMRAGKWSTNRDRAAARTSWQRARQVAGTLPPDEPARTSMQIASLKALCGTLWLTGGSVADSGFEQLRELCALSGDKTSLAIGMAGVVMTLTGHNRHREAARLSSGVGGVDSVNRRPRTDLRLSLGGYVRQVRDRADDRSPTLGRTRHRTSRR